MSLLTTNDFMIDIKYAGDDYAFKVESDRIQIFEFVFFKDEKGRIGINLPALEILFNMQNQRDHIEKGESSTIAHADLRYFNETKTSYQLSKIRVSTTIWVRGKIMESIHWNPFENSDTIISKYHQGFLITIKGMDKYFFLEYIIKLLNEDENNGK